MGSSPWSWMRGIEAREEQVVHAGGCGAGAPKLVQGDGQQPQQGGAAGQPGTGRCGRTAGTVRCRSARRGRSRRARPRTPAAGQQGRHALDLVQDDAARPRRDEPLRVVLGEPPVVRRFQVDVGEIGQRGPAERRLARLSRPGDGDERVPAEQLPELRRDRPWDHGGDCRWFLRRLKVEVSICARRSADR